jgi:hypothetical protein
VHTRYLVKHSKTISWKVYTSSLDNQTDPSAIWCKIKSLKGTHHSNNIQLLNNLELISAPKDVVNTFGNFFQKNSSNSYYDEEFLPKATDTTPHPLCNTINPNDTTQIQINLQITLEEIKMALKTNKSKSPEPDGIPYAFIQNFPPTVPNIYLISSILYEIIRFFQHTGDMGSISLFLSLIRINTLPKAITP